MQPVSIRRKGEKLGILNIIVIFLLFMSFYSKNLSFEGFSNKNPFMKFFHFGKKIGSKKVPHLKFILLINYLAVKGENLSVLVERMLERIKKTVCQNVNRYRI
jgi:hypothetical protein